MQNLMLFQWQGVFLKFKTFFSFFQRTSNVDNSTYDLYQVPKDSDSSNPDGKFDEYGKKCYYAVR